MELKDGDTALHWAVFKGQEDIVRMLLEVTGSKHIMHDRFSDLLFVNSLAQKSTPPAQCTGTHHLISQCSSSRTEKKMQLFSFFCQMEVKGQT
jgi:ankyrin repeat protein